jgi:hypothetical protein
MELTDPGQMLYVGFELLTVVVVKSPTHRNLHEAESMQLCLLPVSCLFLAWVIL